jgi:hypothetical protein
VKSAIFGTTLERLCMEAGELSSVTTRRCRGTRTLPDGFDQEWVSIQLQDLTVDQISDLWRKTEKNRLHWGKRDGWRSWCSLL